MPHASGAADGGPALAARWLACYERLAARAAHEVNNALNGVAMNLEVVRLRARPGADAGAAARFVDAAQADYEATAALAGALVALGRTPRAGPTDVGEVLAHAAALFAPLVRQQGGELVVERSGGAARTAAPARAVRLALCALFEAALDGARGSPPPGPLRCTLHGNAPGAERPTLVASPAPAGLPADLASALAPAGVDVQWAPGAVRLAFVAA